MARGTNGIDRFEGRSSLKTWTMRIVVNIAISRGEREARSVPFSSFASEGDEPAVDPDRFRDAGDGFPGHWRAYPGNWASLPDDTLLGRETLEVIKRAIEDLPPAQRVVITCETWPAAALRRYAALSMSRTGTSACFCTGPGRTCGARSRGIWMAESHDHLSCQEVVELVTGYLDGALPAEEAALFEQHLNFCEGCVWYLEQIKTTVETLGEVREEDIPSEAKDRLVSAFRDWRGS